MKTIIITGEKGGTGKSTITAFLCEYLNYLGKRVQLIDLDPLQIIHNYANNCQSEGRIVTTNIKPDYQLIDTAGITGSSLIHARKADLIIVPFRPHYIDLLVIIPWFSALERDLQKKVWFLPNYWKNTKEQRQGIKEIEVLIAEKQVGAILSPLPDKPAKYGTIINGFPVNYFAVNKEEQLSNVMKKIVEIGEEK